MITCPMCKKKVPGLEKKCANCKTDVSLLVDYVENLRDGLKRAEQLTKKGELGDAVWEYLEVLEVDPDNATARRQVGKVATAVRQFDQTAPGRRWQKKLKRQTAWRRFLANISSDGDGSWLGNVFWFAIVLAALVIGFFIGKWTANLPSPSTAPGGPAPAATAPPPAGSTP
jgi:hypothetical protein